ncbi:hypothetical protein BGW37DRAFT_508036 [Umbelopsis sp. PMI_123]|nr:hypothetical protein BGW37DRAFT_508036 [Umbelopsis sp. PMI_123]
MRFNSLVILITAAILFTVGNAQVTSVISKITVAPSTAASHISSVIHPTTVTASASGSALSSAVGSATSVAATATASPHSAAAITSVSDSAILQMACLLAIFAVSFGMMLV